jgi:hypothetical protein
MTEPAAANRPSVNEARWLRTECVLAHVVLAVLLVLGPLVGWSGAANLGVDRMQGVLFGIALPVGIYFIYSLIYGFRVWVSMDARLEQLAQTLSSILTGQNEGFASFVQRIQEKTAAPSREPEADTEQERALVAKIERENADWLYDAQGNPTKEAEAVRYYIEQARRLGIKGAQARWDYATAMVERDLLQKCLERNRQSEDRGQPTVESRDAPPPII